MHAGVIIRSSYSLHLEFAVIAAFWLAFFIDYHRTDVGETACIGNIKSLHSRESLESQQIFNLLHCTNGSALFPADTFSVLTQYQGCISGCKVNQLFLGAFQRHS